MNECLASLITVSLKVTIDKVKTRYRSRFQFSSDIRMFPFFSSRSFTVQFIHYKYFCFTINIERTITSFYIFFFAFFCFRTTIKRNNCYNKQKSQQKSCHFRVYLFKSTTFSESALTLSHRSLSNIFLRRQGEEPVCIINFSVTTLLKLIKEFNLIFQQWRSQSTSYCGNWNSGRFQPYYISTCS